MSNNNHVVNGNGRGNDRFSDTFHGLRRTQDGKLYYTLRDKNVGTFSNDGGTTELSSDADYVAVEEQYISGKNQTFAGDGSDKTFTLSDTVFQVRKLTLLRMHHLQKGSKLLQDPEHLEPKLEEQQSSLQATQQKIQIDRSK